MSEEKLDPEALRVAYTVLGAERVDYNVRKWDVLRIAALFALGTFAASAGLLAKDDVPRIGYLVAGPVLVFSSALMWAWARAGIKRESRLQYSVEFSMYQIELLLGLHAPLAEAQRWLPQQERMFSAKHTSWRFRSLVEGEEPVGDEDLDWWLDRKVQHHGFVRDVDLLFAAFLLGSVGFGIALFALGL